MKKISYYFTLFVLILSLLAGCSSSKNTSSTDSIPTIGDEPISSTEAPSSSSEKPTSSVNKPATNSSSKKPTASKQEASKPTEAPFNGLKFGIDNYWESSNAEKIMIPTTYEATITMPTYCADRGGVIFGTYSDDTTKPAFNFEIYENGIPRIYIRDAAGNVYDIKFSQVNVCAGVPIHLAITFDYASKTWKCYVDGILEETVIQAAPQPFEFNTKARIGGDLRNGSSVYLKGLLKNVALYSDIRTEKEIQKDALGNSLDTNNIICAVEPKKSDTKVIKASKGVPYSFNYHSLWLTDCAVKNYDYSFAVLGDIQTLTYQYPDKLGTLFDWIVSNANSQKIKFCVGLGDITDRNFQSEYDLVNQQYAKLLGKVPFSIIRGNHDRDPDSSGSTLFDLNITQERYSSQITGAFDSTMLNTYKIQQIGEEKYLFLNLDFTLKNVVLDWANQVISENPDCRVIISTHIYFGTSGQYYPNYYYAENGSRALWEKVASQHKNVIMVLNGHTPTDNILHKTQTGVNGNKVTEILIDPQTTDKNFEGLGLVAMFYFSDGGNKLDIRYYSTVRQAYFLPQNQFSLTLN